MKVQYSERSSPASGTVAYWWPSFTMYTVNIESQILADILRY